MINYFCPNDTEIFLDLALSERWLTSAWEISFTLSAFPGGCFAARNTSGNPVGFVTALPHEKSGWIGNLIVSQEWRGQGIGEKLFLSAFNALKQAGVETTWLTASKMGQSLYEKHGFCRIDTINRWVGVGRGENGIGLVSVAECDHDMDYIGWNDHREQLLAAVKERGECLTREDCFAVLQPCGQGLQVGPFAAVDPAGAEALLQDILDYVPKGCPIYSDAPAGNHALLALMQKHDFRINSSSELMYSGVKPAYRPNFIYGLASMGSIG